MRISTDSQHPLLVARAQAEFAAQVAGEQSLALGIPQLIGSDRQVAWGQKIREHTLSIVSAHLRELGADAADPVMQAAIGELKGERAADWWIDNRWKDGAMMVKEALGRYRCQQLHPV